MRLPEWIRAPFASAAPATAAPKLPDPPADEEPDDADEETQGERDERRRFLVLWFRSHLKAPVEHRVEQLTATLADGEIDSQGWAAAFRLLLSDGHAEAASVGRRLAGDLGPFSEEDRAAGAAAWQGQEEFFQGFLADLEAGRYTKGTGDDAELNRRAFDARAKQYAAALKGTACEAFRDSMGDEPLDWNLTPAEHCKPSQEFAYNCPDLAAESPKPASEWQTVPGGGKTPCRNHCLCHLSGGGYSTEGL